MEDWRNTNQPRQRTLAQKIIESGINSPGTTLSALLPAIYFVVGDLMTKPLDGAAIQQIAMWTAIALIGWFAKDHNVSSKAAGVE